MQFKKKPLVAAVFVGGVMAFAMTGCNKTQPQQARGPLPVVCQEMQYSVAVAKTQLPGRTSAYQVAEVRPQASGIILKRLFTEGSEVKEGQSLFQIDPSVYEASLQSARASLAQAEADLAVSLTDAKRSAALVKSNAVSKAADDAAQAKLKVARANVLAARAAVKTAEVNLKYTQVTSPISGQVSLSEVTPGALVGAGQAARLTVVQQLDPIYVDVSQSYDEIARLKANIEKGALKDSGDATVTLTLGDGTKYPHVGKLTFKDALVDSATGSVRIRALFPNPDRLLLPGMYVRATLVDGVRENAFKLDQRATMRRTNGAPYVYIVNKEGKVESRDIHIASTEGTNWVVDGGLNVGDKVIVEGILKVRPGAPVTPVLPGAKKPQGK